MTSIALLEPVWRVAWIYAQPSIFDKLFLRKETPPLHGRFPNSEFFWSAFSRIRTEYRYLFFTLTSTEGKYRPKKIDFGQFLRRNRENLTRNTLREKCPYSGFFRSVFPRISTDYREILWTVVYPQKWWYLTCWVQPISR